MKLMKFGGLFLMLLLSLSGCKKEEAAEPAEPVVSQQAEPLVLGSAKKTYDFVDVEGNQDEVLT